MRLLYGYLRDKDVDGIRLIALELGAALFAALTVALLGRLRPTGAWQYVVVFLGAAACLTLLVRVLQRLLLAAWARPILGRWVSESSTGTWGLARIDVHGGELRYAVQLYRNEADVLAAVRGDRHAVSACFATVASSGVTFRGGDRVELVYRIDHTDGEHARQTGILVLTPLDRRTMKGFWSRDLATGRAGRGTLDLRRARYVRAEARRAAKAGAAAGTGAAATGAAGGTGKTARTGGTAGPDAATTGTAARSGATGAGGTDTAGPRRAPASAQAADATAPKPPKQTPRSRQKSVRQAAGD